MTARAVFKQADLNRALDVAQRRGLAVTGYEIKPDGTIRVLTADAAQQQALSPLERWELENGDRAA